MKNFFKLVWLVAIAAIIGFSISACDSGGGGGGGYYPSTGTATYSGTTAAGDLFSLEIANNAKAGDSFEFTWTTSSNETKTSTGTIKEVNGNEFTMLPSNAATPNTTFTATVDNGGLSAMSGTFTWTDGTTTTGSGTLIPVAPPTRSSSSSGGGSTIIWTPVEDTGIWDTPDDRFFEKASINAIAYGNGKFVAVGDKSKIATSPDGKTWTAVTNNLFTHTYESSGDTYTDDIRAIAFGNNTFVAGGGTMVTYSTDGVNWSATIDLDYITTTGIFGDVYAIAYGNGKFIAGSGIGKMAYSTDDGKTWIVVADSKFEGYSIKAIAYGNGVWIAVGASFLDDIGKMVYSTDNGITWTVVANSITGATKAINTIAYGNGKWVAGGAGYLAYSSNGTTWLTSVLKIGSSEMPGSTGDHTIAYGNNKFVGSNMYSSDGKIWTYIESDRDLIRLGDYDAIAFGNGTFVIGSYNGQIAYSTGN